MRMKWAWLSLLTGAALCAPLRADMATLRSNVTYYGTVVRLTDKQLVLRATFPNQKVPDRELLIPRQDLLRVEFNDQKTNGGSPPEAFGAHDGMQTASNNQPRDSLVFREGGQVKSCPGIVLDEKTITCGTAAYDRSERTVWRIYFGDL